MTTVSRTILVAIICLFTSVCRSTPLVEGSSSFLGVWNVLTTAFAQVAETDVIPYVSVSTLVTVTTLAQGASTAGLSEISLEELRRANTAPTHFPFATSIPFLVQAYNVVYNVPNLSMSVHLILNMTALEQIFLGEIIYWDDPVLVQLNPDLAQNLSHNEIRLVQRQTESGTNYVFTRSLSAYSTEWAQRYGTVLLWPLDLETNTTLVSATSHVFAISGFVQANPYSMAFISMSYYYTSIVSISSGINYAYFQAVDGTILEPNTTNVRNAVEDIRIDENGTIVGLITRNDTWPVIGIGYLIFNVTTVRSACEDVAQVLRFLNWVFTTNPAELILEQAGYFTPAAVVPEILARINTIDCDRNGIPLLSPSTSFAPRTGQATVTGAFILVIILSGILTVIYSRESNIAIVYSVTLILALVLQEISMIMWVIEPVSDGICFVRWWFLSLGLSIVTGAVFARSYQLKKIHQLVKGGLYQSTRRINHTRLTIVIISGVIATQVVLLIVLQLVLPFQSKIAVLDNISRTGEYQCQNSDLIAWVSSITVYLYLVLFVGIYTIYSTWGISGSVDDTRINVMMIFVCLVVIIVGDISLFNNGYTTDDGQSWWAIIVQSLWGISMACIVFLPKMVKSYSKSSDSSNNITSAKLEKQGNAQ